MLNPFHLWNELKQAHECDALYKADKAHWIKEEFKLNQGRF